MKSFDKLKILDNINNIEVKKTINKFLDGLVSMEKNYKDIFVSNFLLLWSLNMLREFWQILI